MMNQLDEPSNPHLVRAGERGMVLVLVSIGVMSLSMMSLVVLSMSSVEHQAVRSTIARERAWQLAEAGLDLGISELRLERDLADDGIGPVNGRMDDGVYITSCFPAFSGEGSYTLSCIAEVDRVRVRVEATLDLTAGLEWPFAIFGDEEVKINSESLVDSYDSRVGPYSNRDARAAAMNRAVVGSNGGVLLNSRSRIEGDVRALGQVDLNGDSEISGSTAPATERVRLDPVTFDLPPGSLRAFELNSGSRTWTSRVVGYSSFILNSGSRLIIQGEVDLYVTDGFLLNSQSRIDITSGSRLRVFHGSGDFIINSGSSIRNANAAASTFVLRSATDKLVALNSDADVIGQIYAPRAEVVINSIGDLYGAVVGRTVLLNSSGDVHYDLGSASGGGGTGRQLRVRMMR